MRSRSNFSEVILNFFKAPHLRWALASKRVKSVFFLALFLFTSAAFAQKALHPNCLDYLLPLGHRPALYSPLRWVSDGAYRSTAAIAARPEFINLTDEIARDPYRKGLPLPAAMAHFLPESLSAISHSVLSNDSPASVRFDNPSNHIYARYSGRFKGRSIGTNLMTGTSTLRARLINPPAQRAEFLVDRSAEALIFWVHGGGTPTANASTAATLIDHLNKTTVQVLSTDMPLHGEGPTYPFTTEEEVFEYLLGLIDELVHPDVPVFFAGHSMGGQYATMLHKLSYKAAIRKRIVGVIALSPVADPAPGQSLLKKQEVEKEHEAKAEERYGLMAPSDRVFIENIIRNGKNAVTAMMHVYLMKLYLDWTPPTAEQRDQLLPMLAIIGQKDGLTYVGYEQQFDEYFRSLGSSARLEILGQRENIHGKLEWVGHGIFDHYLPGTKDTFETTHLILEFISQTLLKRGIDFKRLRSYDAASEQKASTSTAWIKTWLHNLAFREFVENYTVYTKKLHPNLAAEGDVTKTALSAKKMISDAIQKASGAAGRSAKSRPRAPIFFDRVFETIQAVDANLFRSVDDLTQALGSDFHDRLLAQPIIDEEFSQYPPEVVQALRASVEEELQIYEQQILQFAQSGNSQWPGQIRSLADFSELLAANDRYLASVKGQYVPREASPEKRAEILAIVEEKTRLEKERARLSNLVQSQIKVFKLAKFEREAVLRELYPLLKSSGSPEFNLALQQSEEILSELQTLNLKIGELQFNFLIDLFERDELTAETVFNLPSELREIAEQYRETNTRYRQSLDAVVELQKAQAREGRLVLKPSEQEVKGWSVEKIQQLATQAWDTSNPESVVRRIQDLVVELDGLTSELMAVDMQIGELLVAYDQMVPGIFVVERRNLLDLLNTADQPDFFHVMQDTLRKGAFDLWLILADALPITEREDVQRSLPFE